MAHGPARFGHFIDGAWVLDGEAHPNINPSDTNDVVGQYAAADAEIARVAVAASLKAFPAWATASGQVRADALDRIAGELAARAGELGDLLAREEGKTLPEAKAEVARAAQIFRYFAGEAVRNFGEHGASIRPGVLADVTREPVGVVLAITPWNFPAAIPAWKVAPALAFGNCVILKPAELTPGSAWALADIISRSGLPDGVFNLVMGRGSDIGDALADDSRIDAISFTGSNAIGRRLRDRAVQRGVRVQTEMGGKNPLVVLADCNLDNAVECALNGAFFSTGQRCTASSRLIVESEVHDAFVDRLIERMRALRVGDARGVDTDIGPVIDERQLAQNLRYLALAKEEAGVVVGGDRVERSTPGYFMEPALVLATKPSMTINRDEVFGPIASVIRVSDYDEALGVANDTEFGLSAGICTRSLARAEHFKRHAQAGMAMVNLPTAGIDYNLPFGGRKGSSFGPREQGAHARDFYTVTKTAYTLPL